MAIFYEHIKGCGPKNIYTSWIKWSDEEESPSSTDAKYLPQVYIGDKNTSFGSIITSQATGQSINEDFTFNEQVTFNEQITFNKQARFNESVTFAHNILLEWNPNQFYTINTGSQGKFDFEGARQIKIITTKENNNFIEFDTSIFKTQNIEATTIDVSGKCQAKYFNATSDARAKSNITPAQFSALDVIKQLPIYTFNYLNDPKLSVGLIAQEAAEHDLDGFNMVDNLDASGEFGDYMQMKESKLVYVLWKAVQELTDEVNSLKAQIQQLENK